MSMEVKLEMDELESTKLEDDAFAEFTLAEIMKMENLHKKMGKKQLNLEFYQQLAAKFSSSTHRRGKSFIKCEQVRNWFMDKRKQTVAKVLSLPVGIEEVDYPSIATTTNSATKINPKSKGERIAELSELVFEAKSSKDGAWFDVGTFLSYRVVHKGELEVRVRFAGFGPEEDEWVNVKRAVRQRSIPLEHSECQMIKVGDHVLCFRESEDYAIYCDAYVVEIGRKLHDMRGCRCIFVVRYDYDNSEDKVPLSKLCSRPS